MSSLFVKVGRVWEFTRGKHVGEGLEDVASEDPSYIKWIYDEADDLDEEQTAAIEEVAEEWGIDL